MHYHIEFNPLPKSLFVNNDYKMLHADKLSILDNKTGNEIGYSRRYMAYSSMITRISDAMPKFDYTLGDIQVYEFDDKVLFRYADADRGYDINRKYKLYSGRIK